MELVLGGSLFMNFLSDKYNDIVDENLIKLILDGNKEALNSLISRHKDWVYNIALRMTGNTHEAEDITQEILIKVVTKLSTFKFKSSFKTWVYRITFNQIMTMKRLGKENVFSSFDEHKNLLDSLPDKELEYRYPVDAKLLVEETKGECMSGMLLCLNREQRIVFILGGIFGIDSKSGADLLEISEVNYRKRLSRARHELKNFMNDNCSLLNKNNSCKCSRKTRAAIEKGYINPEKLQYADNHVKRVKDIIACTDTTVNDMIDLRYQELFKESPYKIFEIKEFSNLIEGFV